MEDRSLFRTHKVEERVLSIGEINEKQALIEKTIKREQEFKKRNPGKDVPVDKFKARKFSEQRELDKRLRKYMNDPSS